MSTRTIAMTEELNRYLVEVGVREPALYRRLSQETAATYPHLAEMQTAPEQCQLMALLVEAIGARRALEVGTFTGYSALWLAAALPPDGKLVCCDLIEEYTDIARKYWREAGLSERIELRLGPALETLAALAAGGEAGEFDFAYLDAAKDEYDAYYEHVLTLLRPGGLMAFDNMLNRGRVLDLAASEHVNARHADALNRKMHQDERVTVCLAPVGDGLMLARKR